MDINLYKYLYLNLVMTTIEDRGDLSSYPDG